MSAQTIRKQQQDVVDSAIASISHIATLPEITLKIIELVEDPTSTAQDLHNVIARDPALCSRILKVVNSAFYGLPRQIGSINRAIVLLGLNAVKNIAIATSLNKLFKGGDLCPHFSARDLWTHSIATAACSKLVSDNLRLNLPDEAFLAGLIHDIGIMVEMQAMRSELAEVFAQLGINAEGMPQRNMLEVEREVLGADHQAFGAALCETWKFPKSFGYVTGHHHDPMTLPESSRLLSMVVYVADHIAGESGFGFRADLQNVVISPDILAELRLNLEQVNQIREALPQVIDDVEATFAVEH